MAVPLRRARRLHREAIQATRLRRAQEASRFRAMSQAMPDLIMVLDEDGRYLDLYTLDEARLVSPRSQMLGRTVYECLPLESARFIHECVQRALREGSVITVEYPLAVQAGNLSLEARIAAMDDSVDGKRCVVWVSRDITERRRQEEQLRQTQKLESLGVLAGGIAHDFNNLLMTMQGNLDLARMDLSTGSSSAKYLGRAEGAIRKASDLAKQMLAYAGCSEFHIEDLDLNRIVQEMTGLLGVSISKNVALEFSLEAELPAIRGDRTQLQQVVMNLVTNASEAIGDEEGQITISTSFRELSRDYLSANLPTQNLEPGSYAVLSVSDTGSGMSSEVLARIFDPFFSTKHTGRGLGLSIMLGILRGHRGGILIHSRPGRGSTFTAFIPCQAQGVDVPALPEASLRETKLRTCVLVVDDEADVREAIQGLLEALGMDVLEARDGLMALDILAREKARIDVVLLDLTMPRMNGVQTFKALRSRGYEVPVVFSSGYTSDAIAEFLQEPGVGFLLKPYQLHQLQSALMEVVDQVGQETA